MRTGLLCVPSSCDRRWRDISAASIAAGVVTSAALCNSANSSRVTWAHALRMQPLSTPLTSKLRSYRRTTQLLKYISNSQLYATYALNCQSQVTHPPGVCKVGQVHRSATHAIRHHHNPCPQLMLPGYIPLDPNLRIFSNSAERAGNRAVVDRIC